MTIEQGPLVPVDRKLHRVNRGGLAFLRMIADVLMILWLVAAWEALRGEEPVDATWIASAVVRLVAFFGMAATAFYATMGSQPKGKDPGAEARPRYKHVRLRVVSAVFAALLFGDMAASSAAVKQAGFVDIFHAALLGGLVLVAVVCIAVGRALLRLWKDSNELDKVPVWSELTELQAGKVLPSLGLHTAWLFVFLVSWWTSDQIPPLWDFGGGEASSGFALAIGGILLALIGLCFVLKREKVLAGTLRVRVHPRIDMIMAVTGALLSVHLGGRLLLSGGLCSGVVFCVTTAVCALGLMASLIVTVRAIRFWRMEDK